MSHKLLTISVASYNAERWISKCLDSFVDMRIIDDIEVLIVNDGSSDHTYDVALSYQNKYPETFVACDKPNGGHGSTINYSIAHASGKYFKTVDSDDWVETENLCRLVENLRQIDCDLVINPYYEVNAETGIQKLRHLTFDNSPLQMQGMYTIDMATDKDKLYLQMHGMTIKTEILRQMSKEIDENCFYVDVEYVLFPMQYIESVYVLDYPIYDYLFGTNEQSVNRVNMIKRRAQHLKVCYRLVDFYSELLTMGTKEVVLKAIRERILIMILAEYNILFALPVKKESKDELRSFDQNLKQKNKQLYEKTLEAGKLYNVRSIVLLNLLRQTKFLGYTLILGAKQLLQR